jgi:hypothetical protein
MYNQLYSNDNYKVKSIEGVVCTGVCLYLRGKKLVFLNFTNVDPQSSNLIFPS